MSGNANDSMLDRRLAAIMFTDIVGYTSLMQQDEAKALQTIERHRSIIEKFTKKYHGDILHYYGDGSLSIFPSAFEAVEAALEIQKELTREPRIPLRIGMHLGDVKQKGKAVFGDGINLASRVESMAVGGSVLITDAIYHIIKNQSDIKTVSLGNFQLKNVDYPIPLFALSADYLAIPDKRNLPGRINSSRGPSKWTIIIAAVMVLIMAGYAFSRFYLHEKIRLDFKDKSIAVLPFENLSNDPQQEYFSDGITYDIINHLVKIPELRVKSKTSTRQYKRQDKTSVVIGQELGVAFILGGSVRKADNKVRVVAQLIDTRKDLNVWTETFDREITEIFQIQSEIAMEIAKVLETALTGDVRHHIAGRTYGQRKATDITAYDYELRAREIWRNWNNEDDLERAMQLINQAIALDSSYARGYVLLGNMLHYGMRNFGVPTQVWIDEALSLANHAINLDTTLAEAYLLRGNILRNQPGKGEEARYNLKKAYYLEPGNTEVLRSLGAGLMSHGEYERGAVMIVQAIEREYSFNDPEYYSSWGNLYLMRMTDYKKAEEYLLKAISLEPGWISPYHRLGHVYRYWGKLKKAKEILLQALEISPSDQAIIDLMGWVSYLSGELDNAAHYWSMYDELESQFTDTTQYVPFRHRLGYIRYMQGETALANNLIKEQLNLDQERHQNLRGYGAWTQGGFYYDLAASNAFLGKEKEALMWLDSASQLGFINLWYLENDPLLENIRNTPEFLKIKKELAERMMATEKAFKKAIAEKDNL
jgi:adenylate cyclase